MVVLPQPPGPPPPLLPQSHHCIYPQYRFTWTTDGPLLWDLRGFLFGYRFLWTCFPSIPVFLGCGFLFGLNQGTGPLLGGGGEVESLDLQSTTAVSKHTVSSVNQILVRRRGPRGSAPVPSLLLAAVAVFPFVGVLISRCARFLTPPPRFSRAIVGIEDRQTCRYLLYWQRTLRMRLRRRPSSCSIPPCFSALHPLLSHGVTHGLYLTRAPHLIPAPPILIHFCLEGKTHSAPGRAFFHAATLRRFTHTQTTALLWS